MNMHTQTEKPILSLTYDQIDQWIESLRPELLRERFAMVIGVLRGGAPLALMASHAVGAPVAFLRRDRDSRHCGWDSASIPMPPPGSKVLLCEDVAGQGFTLADCVAFLENQGLSVKVLVGAVDELSRVRPDYAQDAQGYFALFPWARQAPAQSFPEVWPPSALASSLGAAARDQRAHVYAIGLDSFFSTPSLAYALPAAHAPMPAGALPGLDPQRVALAVAGRAQASAGAARAWLLRQGFSRAQFAPGLPLEAAGDDLAVAAHKAQAALRARATHFVEGDSAQALLVAQRAPLLRVIWWNAQASKGVFVNASAWSEQDA